MRDAVGNLSSFSEDLIKSLALRHEPVAVTLAPVYDVVNTTAYIRKDVPALSLAGTKKCWPRKMLERFAVAYLSLPAAVVSASLSRLAEAVTETRGMIPGYIAEHPEFREIGERMMAAWDEGLSGLRMA